MQGRNIATSPQEQSGNIADGRTGTASIGCNDYNATEDEACFTFGNKFARYGNHYYHSCQVAQKNGHEEGNDTQNPQQFTLCVGLDGLCYNAKTSMRVNDVDDGHGAKYEEEGRGNISQTTYQFYFGKFKGHVVDRHLSQFGKHGYEFADVCWRVDDEELFCIEQEDNPQKYGHADGGGGFVDLDNILKSDGQDSEDEHHRHKIIEEHGFSV
jgi:hypothetical protein